MNVLFAFFIILFLNLQLLFAQTTQDDSEQNITQQNTQVNTLKDTHFNEQFMTEKEYGSYLYQDPRGISCKVCHGEYGKGSTLGTYTSKGKTYELNAPDITNLDLKRFTRALRISKGVMPKYYLTDSEIEALYRYISEIQQ